MTGGRIRLNARISPPPALATWTHPAVLRCAGEDCPCARGALVHPPALVMFDQEAGEYRQARLRCVAVWAAGTSAHTPGQICGEPGTHQIADVVLCVHHYRRMRAWMDDRDQRDVNEIAARGRAVQREAARVERERAAQQAVARAGEARQEKQRLTEAAKLEAQLAREVERERVRAAEAARAEVSVVYFVRRESDGLVKIGTSRGLAARMPAIKRENGPLQLLATAGGSHKEEAALHRKFAALRAEGEWFRPEKPLLDHVYALMKARPLEPAANLPPIVPRVEIGRILWKMRMDPVIEMRRAKAEQNEKRRLARQRRAQEAAAGATEGLSVEQLTTA